MSVPAPPKKNHAWIWFFLLLIVASVGLSMFMVSFNRRRQLKSEQLEAAMERWKAHGPRSYLMSYTVQVMGQGRAEQFVVKVKDGRVREVLQDGRPLEPEQLAYHSMERLFGYVEKFLDLDNKPNQPRTFTVAVFDETNGALSYYVRSVMGTAQRVEMHVRLEDLPS